MTDARDPVVLALRALTLEPWSDDAGPKFRAILARHGLAVVPVKPTEAMCAAGTHARIYKEDEDGEWADVNTKRSWSAMLAAAQEPQR